jgi:hypothetical protein
MELESCVRVPVVVAAEALFEGFQKLRPELLGVLKTRDAYREYAGHFYKVAFNCGSAWVVGKPFRKHLLELHVYAFDHRLSRYEGFFEWVLKELDTEGFDGEVIPLWPGTGNVVRKVLRSQGFKYAAKDSAEARFYAPYGATESEIWYRISLEEKQ